ncbi:Vacuolar protein sorting-associated protein 13 [Eumeta japonica]|uniref:Vacuolar protein sorting-associated protein 13 n=1 Tax=Eumeta variegata TaxID=151549 RepID=A0A4C1W940_EUMVA|nr:Vacuolar protein sorting-associated protein 13 [Eumeta japonica]
MLEEAEEAINTENIDEVQIAKPPIGEICILGIPNITLSLEMEIGSEYIPILVMQAALNAQVKDWSSELYVESTWTMQISYYNIKRALWEPLLEPVEVLKENEYKHVPWEMKLEVVMHSQENPINIDTTDEAANYKAIAQRQANKTITLSCTETLEITMSRTCMEMLTLLGNSFAAAAQTETEPSVLAKSRLESTASSYPGAPYVLHNSTGLTAKIVMQESQDFTVFRKVEDPQHNYKEVVLEAGASVPLQLKKGRHTAFKLNEKPQALILSIKVVELDIDLQLRVERADKRYFALGRNKAGNTLERTSVNALAAEPRGMISEVVMKDGAMQIYLRSVVQVINTLSVNVSVYYMTLSGNEVRLLSEVKPGGTLRLPLQAVHTPTGEIFFSVEGFTVSVSPFIWRELQQEVKSERLLQCNSKDKTSKEKFYLKAVGTMEQVFFENTNKQTFASSCYDIVLKPAVKMQNCLPLEIVVSQSGFNRTQTFKPGEMFHLSNLEPHKATIVVMMESYLEKCWVATENLPAEDTELSVWTFDSHDSPSVITMNLGMHSVDLEGTQMLSLYCPFWMLNKTGLTLSYRNYDDTGNVIFHPPIYKDPILFSFRAKNFFGKKKAAIRVDFGEWSEKFSLDVPGSSGVVLCKNEGRTYQVAVTNQLTFNSLTKMVVFTPFFLIINEAPFPIQYQELSRSGDPWQEVEASSSAPLWPLVEKEDKLLLVRVSGSTEHAAPFLYTEQHSTALQLNNQTGFRRCIFVPPSCKARVFFPRPEVGRGSSASGFQRRSLHVFSERLDIFLDHSVYPGPCQGLMYNTANP